MKITSKLINFSLSAFLLAASSTVAAQEATSLSGLLNLVEGDKVSESAEYRARLQNSSKTQRVRLKFWKRLKSVLQSKSGHRVS